MSQELIIEPSGDDMTALKIWRNPKTMITEAKIAADTLMEFVAARKLSITFGTAPKPHLYFEAWAFLAHMFNVTSRVVPGGTKPIVINGITGWESEADAYHVPSGQIISTANAMCLSDEDNWSVRAKYEWRDKSDGSGREKVKVGDIPVPQFQLRSMAETRAQAKALKGPFSWVIAMAGFDPTVAEDMRKDGASVRQPQQPQQQRPASTTDGSGPRRISEKQAGRMFGIAKTANKSTEEVLVILKHFGFEAPEDVTVAKYDDVCAEIARSDSA